MDALAKDLLYALRSLRRAPGFTVAALLCLALGIGANTATFSFVNAMLLRPLPVGAPEELVRIYTRYDEGIQWGSLSYLDYVDLRDQLDVFSGILATRFQAFNLSSSEDSERVFGALVSRNYFELLGPVPALGRGFLTSEDVGFGEDQAVILSHGFWQRRFGGAADILGRELILNGQKLTVVGVAPEGFLGTDVGPAVDLWAPLELHDRLTDMGSLEARGSRSLQAMARLQPGTGADEARAAVTALADSLRESYPDNYAGMTFRLIPESEGGIHPLFRGAFAGFMGLVMAVVGLVLLLTCANVGGLLVARSAGRGKEIGIRIALGASRQRLLRQLMTESLVLSLAAGLLGLAVARLAIRATVSFRPQIEEVPLFVDVTPDTTVLLFTASVALATAFLFGLLPALQSSKPEVLPTLRDETTPLGTGRSLSRSVLVGGQIALSLILLIGAGLFVRALQRAQLIDPGFNPDNAVVASLDVGLSGYDREEGRAFYRNLLERLRTLPGVRAVGLGSLMPFIFSRSQTSVLPEGYEVPPGGGEPLIDQAVVDAGYFTAMGIPLIQGRTFTERDDPDAPRVAIVNQAFADRFWPDGRAVGRKLSRGDEATEVIGVVPTGKYRSLGEDPLPFLYWPFEQRYRGTMTLHLRTAGDPNMLLQAVRREVAAMDPTLPLYGVKTMHQQMSVALLPARMAASILGIFGVIALLLSAVGLYGVLAYAVGQRTREIGVRMALGARTVDVLRLVLRQGLTVTLVGLAVGAVGAFAMSGLVAGFLYGVDPLDPLTLVGVAALLLAVALAACWIPSLRASRVDPIAALRYE